MKRVVAAVYLLLGLASAFVCFQSLMWAVPKDADCYTAFATLQVDGMISNELTTGGVQSYYLFFCQTT